MYQHSSCQTLSQQAKGLFSPNPKQNRDWQVLIRTGQAKISSCSTDKKQQGRPGGI